MKPIYLEILSEGENGVSDSSGENAKGENLGLIAGAELFRMVELFPEMLEMLKVCIPQLPDETAEEVSELIAKAERHE